MVKTTQLRHNLLSASCPNRLKENAQDDGAWRSIIENRVLSFVSEDNAVARHQIHGPMRRPEHRVSADHKVNGGEVSQFQAVAAACRFHFCTPDLQRSTLVDRLSQNPSMVARLRALPPLDDLGAAVQS